MKQMIALISVASTAFLAGGSTTPQANYAALAPKWLTNGLIAYYPFNGNAKDATGHGYNGTAHNATAVSDHLSNPDAAYRLNGTDAYIYFGAVLPDMQTITVTAWVNSSGGGTFFADGDWQLANDFTIQLGTSDTVVRCDKSPAPPDLRYTIPLDTKIDGVWRNMVWVVRTNLVQVYVDGDLKGFVDIQGAGNVGYHDFIVGTMEFPEGSMGWNGYWRGDVSKLRIYNRALSGDEVRQLYAYESAAGVPLEKATTVPLKKAVATEWEYRVEDATQWAIRGTGRQARREIYQSHLNELGRDGWLLIQKDGNLFLFKRPGKEVKL